jgi:hypothetical protein
VLFDGGEFGTAVEAGSLEEQDYLGLPGLLEPHQMATLLRKRQAEQLAARSSGASSSAMPGSGALFDVPSSSRAPAPAPAVPGTPGSSGAVGSSRAPAASGAPAAAGATVSREGLAALRKELNGLVGAWSHRTGQPHGVIHSELRSACGGPAIPQASAEQIQARIDKIRQWALSRR